MIRLKGYAMASVSLIALAGCMAHEPEPIAKEAEYSICDTPDCGDDVKVVVE